MNYTINKGMVKPWLRKLIKHGILVSPTKLTGGDVTFKESFTPDETLIEFEKPLYSVKPFFLPQEETLLTFHNRSVSSIIEVYDEYPRIYFGLRPCDLRAVIQADRFFLENYTDPYYKKRREQTLLITLGCNEPAGDCFCHAAGIGPFYKKGTDIFMVDVGDSFIVEACTARGIDAVANHLYFFETITEEQKAEKVRRKQQAEQRLEANIELDNAGSCYSLMDEKLLSELSGRCASCGSCSYICPLCFCYNIVDRENKDLAGKRVRTWDSCIFEGFTRMAGRHNLIRNRQERLRKRLAHKLKDYPETYGILGCTGCGRCSVTCLGHIGMLEVLKKVTGGVAQHGEK